jgi:hypothetical protein
MSTCLHTRHVLTAADTANRQAALQHRTFAGLPCAQCHALTHTTQGEITKDAIYLDAERRFDELEKETKKLHVESKKYATTHF